MVRCLSCEIEIDGDNVVNNGSGYCNYCLAFGLNKKVKV